MSGGGERKAQGPLVLRLPPLRLLQQEGLESKSRCTPVTWASGPTSLSCARGSRAWRAAGRLGQGQARVGAEAFAGTGRPLPFTAESAQSGVESRNYARAGVTLPSHSYTGATPGCRPSARDCAVSEGCGTAHFHAHLTVVMELIMEALGDPDMAPEASKGKCRI